MPKQNESSYNSIYINSTKHKQMKCKYCFDESSQLFFPCACKTPVCQDCYHKWRSISHRTHCEVCRQKWVNTKIEKIALFLNIMFWTVVACAIFGLYTLGFLKQILKSTVFCTAVLMVLTATNTLVLVPFVYILPVVSPVAVTTCMVYTTVTILNAIDAYF